MKKIRELSFQRIMAIAVAVLIALGLLLYVLATMPKDFSYTEHLEDVALTVTDPDTGETLEITLRELSYYVMLSEENVNRLAEIYNSENTNQFWNLFTNHTFIRKKAKELAYNSCVRDAVYTFEAEKAGMTLTEAEEEAVKERAQDLADGLSYKQQTGTGLTEEIIEKVLLRVTLASKYANDLIKNYDFSYSEHMPEVEVEEGGDYYESVLAKYTVTTADFWDDVTLGNITISQIENS